MKIINNEETIFNRCAKDEFNPFVMTPYERLMDERLSPIDQYLMNCICSNSDGWHLTMREISHRFKIPIATTFRSVKHLKELKYIEKIQLLGRVRWIINEIVDRHQNDNRPIHQIDNKVRHQNDTDLSQYIDIQYSHQNDVHQNDDVIISTMNNIKERIPTNVDARVKSLNPKIEFESTILNEKEISLNFDNFFNES